MKVSLLYRNSDFDLQQALPWNSQALTQDLELNTLFSSMSEGDEFLFEVARKAVLSGLDDFDTILYRQGILKDCLNNPSVVEDIYNIAIETIKKEKESSFNIFGIFDHSPDWTLHLSIDVLHMFLGMLRRLRAIADQNADKFASDGFSAFFAMLQGELSDEYLADIATKLTELEFDDGILISAELGKGNKGTNYTLHQLKHERRSWLKRVLDRIMPLFVHKLPPYTFYVHPRDQAGAKALAELKARGINIVANALAQSASHILNFFLVLRSEMAFYIGCLNLKRKLGELGEPICFPLPYSSNERKLAFKGLYDVCLALTVAKRVVGNDVDANDRHLILITGANQGGKSTFLRSVGLAQLMMQCGMFVAAEVFSANICDGTFTHFSRDEDASMQSGKLDEELRRMNEIVEKLTPNSMLLLNESFAATNEREGSEIARQIVSALFEKRVKIFFVTHLYDFTHDFYHKGQENTIFLRAERLEDSRRTFRLFEGKPLQTSFGPDLYTKIIGVDNSRDVVARTE